MSEKNLKQNKKLVIYQGKNGEIKFRGNFNNDNIILGNLNQIATLFDRDKSVISRHIKNIFKTKELNKNSVVAKIATTALDGKTYQVDYYNLDMILSVGYRVDSKVAVKFRKWTTKLLKQHITKGYTINKKIIGKNYNEFMKAVEGVQKLLPKDSIVSPKDILELVKAFAGTWLSLESYDESNFPKKGFTKKKLRIEADELYLAVAGFKKELINEKQATDLFAQEKKSKNLEGILGNVMQKAFGKEMYPSVEQKAAYLLYFVVKNHPFNDGNKRTGAFVFIWFLRKAGIQFQNKITPEALTAITLLVATSKPKEKDQIVGLVLLLLKK